MTDQPTHDEFYSKIHDHLLNHNQQELAGHLDTLWQELGRLRLKEQSEPKLITSTSDETTEETDSGASGWGYKKAT